MRAIGISAALLLMACGKSPEDLSCPGPRLTACNVFEAECRSLIYRATACERDGAVLHAPPPVSVIEVAEFQDLLREEWEGEQPSSQELHWNRAVALLGLEEPETMTLEGRVENATNGLLGFYQPGQREIVLIQQDAELDPEQAVLTLAHEYVHSLQDETVDLRHYLDDRGNSFDGMLAGRSAIEGEASLFEYFVAARMAGRERESVDWLDLFADGTGKADAYVQEHPSPLALATAVFPYTYGTYTVFEAFGQKGATGITKLRASGAETSVSFMLQRHGEFVLQLVRPPAVQHSADAGASTDAGTGVDAKTGVDAGTSIADVGVAADAGVRELTGAPPEFQASGSYQMGAWLLHGFLLHVTETTPTPQLALAWQDDRMTVFTGPDDALGVVWTIQLTSEIAAEALAEFLSPLNLTRESLRSLVVKRAGNTVHLVITDASAQLTASLADSDLTLAQLASAEPMDAPFASRSRVDSCFFTGGHARRH